MKPSKKLHLRKIIAGCAFISLYSLFAPAGISATLIQNGGFETPSVTPPLEYRTGIQLDGWNSFSSRGIIQFDASYRPVAGGQYAIQIEFPGDNITQSFATTIGNLYQVTFDLSAYDAGGALVGVSAGGATTVFSGINSSYTHYSYNFTATSSLTTLKLANAGQSGISFPHLDNVAAITVPEPTAGTLFLLGTSFFLRRSSRIK